MSVALSVRGDVAYPHARTCFLGRYPALHAGIFDPGEDDHLLEYANYVLALFGESGRPWDEGFDALAALSFEFLKRQARFNRTGQYGATGRDDDLKELYADDSRMEGYYLDGVLLSYAFWPNHVKMLAFYVEEFLPLAPDCGTLFEIGCGPGLMPRLLLDTRPDWHYHVVDRSAASLRAATERLARGGVPERRILTQLGDALDEMAPWPDSVHTAGMCCEVLEHVHAPDRLVARLYRALAPGAYAFISTVANIEAEDHVYCYEDQAAIEAHITAAGFEVVAVFAAPLEGVPAFGRVALNYAAVARKPQHEKE